MTNILILEPSTAGLQLLPTAHHMQLNVFVLSANKDERIIPGEYHQYISKLIIVDTNDLAAISEETLKLHNEHTLSAIIPGFEIYVSLAAELAKLIKVPGLNIETSLALRNKGIMRDKLKSKKIKIPRYHRISSEKDIKELSPELKFPCVLKPIDQSGSMHVTKVMNIAQLSDTYTAMCKDTWTEMDKGIGTQALVEEYTSGEEYSVEGYVDRDHIHVVSITKKFLTPEPLFIEMGHIAPANLSSTTEEIITAYVKDVVVSLNITVGVFHAELKLNSDGAVLMEIAGRLAGCRICDLILLSKNVNLYETMIKSHLGLPIAHHDKQTVQYAGMCYFSLEKDSYTEITGTTELKKLPGFYDLRIFKAPGEYVPPLTTFQGRVGAVIFTAPSYEVLIDKLNFAKSIVRFH